MKLLIYSFVLFIFTEQPATSLITDEWFCNTDQMEGFAYVINDNKALANFISTNGVICSESGTFARKIDFKKFTLLAMLNQPGNYCHINYFRKVVFDKKEKIHVYTVIANGVGLCKKPSIPTAQFVLIPKLKRNQLVKFRFDYIATQSGKDMTKTQAEAKADASDDKFSRIIVTQ